MKGYVLFGSFEPTAQNKLTIKGNYLNPFGTKGGHNLCELTGTENDYGLFILSIAKKQFWYQMSYHYIYLSCTVYKMDTRSKSHFIWSWQA